MSTATATIRLVRQCHVPLARSKLVPQCAPTFGQMTSTSPCIGRDAHVPDQMHARTRAECLDYGLLAANAWGNPARVACSYENRPPLPGNSGRRRGTRRDVRSASTLSCTTSYRCRKSRALSHGRRQPRRSSHEARISRASITARATISGKCSVRRSGIAATAYVVIMAAVARVPVKPIEPCRAAVTSA
jgi:hypothetical protein